MSLGFCLYPFLVPPASFFFFFFFLRSFLLNCPSHVLGVYTSVSFCFLSHFGTFSGGSSLLSSHSSPLLWFACLELGVCDFLFFMWSSWQGVASVFFSSSRPPLPFPCASLVLFSFDGFCLRSFLPLGSLFS